MCSILNCLWVVLREGYCFCLSGEMENKKPLNCQCGICIQQNAQDIADTFGFFQWHTGASEVLVSNGAAI